MVSGLGCCRARAWLLVGLISGFHAVPAQGQDSPVKPEPEAATGAEADGEPAETSTDLTQPPATEAPPATAHGTPSDDGSPKVCRPTAAACLAGCPNGWFRSQGGICVPSEVPPARKDAPQRPPVPAYTPTPSSNDGRARVHDTEGEPELHAALLFNPIGAVAASLMLDEVGVALPLDLQVFVGTVVGLDLTVTPLLGGEVNGAAVGVGPRLSPSGELFSGFYVVPRFVYSSLGGVGMSAELGWSWYVQPAVFTVGAGVVYNAGNDRYQAGVGPLLNLGLGFGG